MKKDCILIVDDDITLRSLLNDLLKREGYRILVASNGEEALEAMNKERPDAIIADVMMPTMDGFSFYEAVRQKQAWVSIPFIFLTAKAEHEDIMRGKALGAEDYLLKPFASNDLLVILKARLKRTAAIQGALQADTEGLKEQIISVLGHELRTPLTFISGYTDLAMAHASQLPNPEFRKFLMGIKFGSDRLMKLIMDLLLVFEIQSGVTAQNFETELVEGAKFEQMITETVDHYTQVAQKKGARLDTYIPEPLPAVRISPQLFCDALGRLINNGIKFTSDIEGKVAITTEVAPRYIKIMVVDNGVGIPPEEIALLFEPFRQLNRDEMEQQGLGIGLYIAQQVILLHQGEVTVSSQSGVGSRFTLQLPLTSTP